MGGHDSNRLGREEVGDGHMHRVEVFCPHGVWGGVRIDPRWLVHCRDVVVLVNDLQFECWAPRHWLRV